MRYLSASVFCFLLILNLTFTSFSKSNHKEFNLKYSFPSVGVIEIEMTCKGSGWVGLAQGPSFTQFTSKIVGNLKKSEYEEHNGVLRGIVKKRNDFFSEMSSLNLVEGMRGLNGTTFRFQENLKEFLLNSASDKLLTFNWACGISDDVSNGNYKEGKLNISLAGHTNKCKSSEFLFNFTCKQNDLKLNQQVEEIRINSLISLLWRQLNNDKLAEFIVQVRDPSLKDNRISLEIISNDSVDLDFFTIEKGEISLISSELTSKNTDVLGFSLTTKMLFLKFSKHLHSFGAHKIVFFLKDSVGNNEREEFTIMIKDPSPIITRVESSNLFDYQPMEDQSHENASSASQLPTTEDLNEVVIINLDSQLNETTKPSNLSTEKPVADSFEVLSEVSNISTVLNDSVVTVTTAELSLNNTNFPTVHATIDSQSPSNLTNYSSMNSIFSSNASNHSGDYSDLLNNTNTTGFINLTNSSGTKANLNSHSSEDQTNTSGNKDNLLFNNSEVAANLFSSQNSSSDSSNNETLIIAGLSNSTNVDGVDGVDGNTDNRTIVQNNSEGEKSSSEKSETSSVTEIIWNEEFLVDVRSITNSVMGEIFPKGNLRHASIEKIENSTFDASYQEPGKYASLNQTNFSQTALDTDTNISLLNDSAATSEGDVNAILEDKNSVNTSTTANISQIPYSLVNPENPTNSSENLTNSSENPTNSSKNHSNSSENYTNSSEYFTNSSEYFTNSSGLSQNNSMNALYLNESIDSPEIKVNDSVANYNTIAVSTHNSANLSNLETEVNTTKIEVNSAKTEVNSAKTEVKSAKTDVNSAIPVINSTKPEINSAKIEGNTSKAEVNSAKTEVNTSKAEGYSTKTETNTTSTTEGKISSNGENLGHDFNQSQISLSISENINITGNHTTSLSSVEISPISLPNNETYHKEINNTPSTNSFNITADRDKDSGKEIDTTHTTLINNITELSSALSEVANLTVLNDDLISNSTDPIADSTDFSDNTSLTTLPLNIPINGSFEIIDNLTSGLNNYSLTNSSPAIISNKTNYNIWTDKPSLAEIKNNYIDPKQTDLVKEFYPTTVIPNLLDASKEDKNEVFESVVESGFVHEVKPEFNDNTTTSQWGSSILEILDSKNDNKHIKDQEGNTPSVKTNSSATVKTNSSASVKTNSSATVKINSSATVNINSSGTVKLEGAKISNESEFQPISNISGKNVTNKGGVEKGDPKVNNKTSDFEVSKESVNSSLQNDFLSNLSPIFIIKDPKNTSKEVNSSLASQENNKPSASPHNSNNEANNNKNLPEISKGVPGNSKGAVGNNKDFSELNQDFFEDHEDFFEMNINSTEPKDPLITVRQIFRPEIEDGFNKNILYQSSVAGQNSRNSLNRPASSRKGNRTHNMAPNSTKHPLNLSSQSSTSGLKNNEPLRNHNNSIAVRAVEPAAEKESESNSSFLRISVMLMILGWGFGADASVFIIRYFRSFSNYIEVHSIAIGIVILLTVISSSLMYSEVSSFSDILIVYTSLLILVFLLIIIQCSLGFVLKNMIGLDVKNDKQLLIKKSHRLVGFLIYIIMKINLLLGIVSMYGFETGTIILYGAYILLLVLLLLLFHFLSKYAFLQGVLTKARVKPISRDMFEIIQKLNQDVRCEDILFENPDVKWAMFKNNIIDLTGFRHPGGNHLLKGMIGTELSRYIYGGVPLKSTNIASHQHSAYALNILTERKIGEINNPNNIFFRARSDSKPVYVKDWLLISKSPINKQLARFQFNSNDLVVRNHIQGVSWFGKYYLVTHTKGQNQVVRCYSCVQALSPENTDIREKTINFFETKYSKERSTSFVSEEHPHYSPTLTLFIKRYPNGVMTNQLFENSAKAYYTIEGPYGPGLQLTKRSNGIHYIFARNTGILPFLDLFDYMLKKIIFHLAEKKFGNIVNKIVNPFDEDYEHTFKKDFRVVLFANFTDNSDFVGEKIVRDLWKLVDENKLDCFDAHIRIEKGASVRGLKNFDREFDDFFLGRHVQKETARKIWICGTEEMGKSISEKLIKIGILSETISVL